MIDKNSKPLFSIITVSYNSQDTIEETIKSVLNQTFQDFEYLIIDGLSNDSTITIIRKYDVLFRKKGIHYTFVSEKDNGIYDAMNKGIKMSSGQYIALLNSDDTYNYNTLSVVNEEIKKNPQYDIYHGMLRFKHGDQTLRIIGTTTNSISFFMIEHPTCFISKDAYEKYGLYDLTYKLAADYDLISRMYKEGAKFYFIEYILANFSVDGRTKGKLSQIETLDIMEKYGYISRLAYIKKRFMLFLSR